MAAENPYTTITISGYNTSPPPDDGSTSNDNKVEWAKHVNKLGNPLKTGIEAADTNVAAAFGALIVTTDPGQEGIVIMNRMFS